MLDLNELYDKWIKWTDMFLSRKSQCKLDADVAEALIHCAFFEKSGNKLDNEDKEYFTFQVLKKRADYYKLYISEHAILAISLACKNPSHAVMFCHALLREQMLTEISATDIWMAKGITVERLCTKIFPFGFPNTEKFDELWCAQKIDGNNLLDAISFQDIQAIKESIANGK